MTVNFWSNWAHDNRIWRLRFGFFAKVACFLAVFSHNRNTWSDYTNAMGFLNDLRWLLLHLAGHRHVADPLLSTFRHI
jgi:hypothetical protein